MNSSGAVLAFFAASALLGAKNIPFQPTTLASDLTGGYQVISCDVNGDGRLDLVALASGLTDLLWFENPGWQRHTLAEHLPRMINVACWNARARTLPLLAVTYEFAMEPRDSQGVVSVLEADGDPRRPWKVKEIDRLPSSHRLRWADIDGSGGKVLVNAPLANAATSAPDYRGHVPLVYYRPGEWRRTAISDAEEGILHGIFVTDWEPRGREAILIGGFLGMHLYRLDEDGKWSRTKITSGHDAPWPKSGTSDVTVGRLRGERFLATIEPWHGNEVAVYRKHAAGWRREVIDDSLLDAHTIATADLDGDGNDEIVAGFRGLPFGVYLYSWSGSGWAKQALSKGEVSAAGCMVADLDHDGRPDIACIGSTTHNLVLYRNLTARH